MLKRGFVVLVIVAAVVAVSLLQVTVLAHTPSPSPCNDPICNIDIRDNFFQLASITIRPPNPSTGQSVKIVWQNHGIAIHSVTTGTGTPDGIIDHTLSPGAIYELNMTQSLYNSLHAIYPNDVIPYYCRFHFGMTATLTIAGAPIPEFSLPTLLLTIAIASIVLLFLMRRSQKRVKEL